MKVVEDFVCCLRTRWSFFAVARENEERQDGWKGGETGAKEEKERRTNIRNKLTSEALACDVSLCRSLDHPWVIRETKEHKAFHAIDIKLPYRRKCSHRLGNLATPGDRKKTGCGNVPGKGLPPSGAKVRCMPLAITWVPSVCYHM